MSTLPSSKPMIGPVELVCPDCGSRDLRRMRRTGFLQNKIYPMFGYYPWECALCRHVNLFKARGQRVRRKKQIAHE